VPEIEWLLEFSADIEAHTLASALDKFETVTGSSLDAFREELERLGIQDDIVTEQAVDRLEFYLQSYEVPIDRENDGVLLADAKSAAYVGRPVVFYLGLDEDWTHSSPRRPLGRPRPGVRAKHQAIPVIATERRRPVHLVQDTAGGTPVTPCLYFEEILDEEFERFSDLDSIQHSRAARTTHDGFGKESIDVAAEKVTAFSQSSLNTYVNSPRDYFFQSAARNTGQGLLQRRKPVPRLR